MIRFGVSAAVLAIGMAAAPAMSAQPVSAQARAELLVCRDGFVTSTRYGGMHACDRHRGVDRNATLRAEQEGLVYGSNGMYQDRSVYDGSIYGGAPVYGVPVYQSPVYTPVYPAPVYRGQVYRGQVYGNTGRSVYSQPAPVYGTTTGGRSVYGGANGVGTNRTVYGTTSTNATSRYDRGQADHHDHERR